MRTRGQSYGRTLACTSWLPTPEPASTRNFSSPRDRSVAGPRRFGLGGGEPVPRRIARMVRRRVAQPPSPCPLPQRGEGEKTTALELGLLELGPWAWAWRALRGRSPDTGLPRPRAPVPCRRE